jgi:hypothetical protein
MKYFPKPALFLIVVIFLLTTCTETPTTLPVSTDTAPATSTATLASTETFTPVPRATNTPTLTPLATVTMPRDGLVAYYPFNGTTNDESGNGNHGTNYGAAFVADRYGKPESAVHFTGQEYIEVPNSYGLNLVDDFSISLWMKPEQPPDNVTGYSIIGKGEYRMLFDGRTDHSGWELIYDLSRVSTDEHPIDFWVVYPPSDDNRTAYHFNGDLRIEKWSCLVVTFDDYLNTLSFYRNGLLSSSFNETFLDLRVNVRSMTIGSFDHPYIGTIDNIAIYDRALSASEAGDVCGVFVDLSTATPTATKKPTSTPLPSPTPLCAPGWTRMQVGGYAIVSPGDPNRVRSEPKKGDNLIATLEAGTVVKVLEGPVCADGLVYWKVENDIIPGSVGWTAEGDGKEYWLEPYNP